VKRRTCASCGSVVCEEIKDEEDEEKESITDMLFFFFFWGLSVES